MLQNFDDRQRQVNNLKCSNINDVDHSISSFTKESLLKERFWPNVVRSFMQYFNLVDLHFEGIFITGEKQQTIKDYFDEFPKKIPIKVRYYTPIDALKEAFEEVDKVHLKYSRQRKECKKLFSELVEKIESNLPQHEQKQYHVLGNIHFNYIGEMLDTQDEDIVKLLPLLLTAYVYNFRKNVFMQRKSNKNDMTESIYDADKTDRKRIRQNLETLSSHFGFADKTIHFSRTEAELIKLYNRPTTFRPSQYPSLDDKIILDLVFAAWCVIFNGVGGYRFAVPLNITKKVDFWLCGKLYTYYTDKSRYVCIDEIDKCIAENPKEGQEDSFKSRKSIVLNKCKDLYKEFNFEPWK